MNKENGQNEGEIVLYHPDESVSIEVEMDGDTVWLTQAQMSELFHTSKQNISLHIGNVFREGELDSRVVVKESLTTTSHGAIHGKTQCKKVTMYNLDVIISVGYRVKSHRGTQFRIWATKVLREYLLRGYAFQSQLSYVENRLNEQIVRHGLRLNELQERVDFLVRTHQQSKEEVFSTGCMWDAYSFISSLIRSAKEQVVLVDNYCDDRTLTLLDKRSIGVSCVVHTTYNKTIEDALLIHNAQYPPIHRVQLSHKIHDRFLIVDQRVFMLGNSLKDMGHTLSAVILTDFSPEEILHRLK